MDIREKLMLKEEMERLKFWKWHLNTQEFHFNGVLEFINERIDEIDKMLLEEFKEM